MRHDMAYFRQTCYYKYFAHHLLQGSLIRERGVADKNRKRSPEKI